MSSGSKKTVVLEPNEYPLKGWDISKISENIPILAENNIPDVSDTNSAGTSEDSSDNPLVAKCRICLENNNQDDMISPCLCKGSAKHVHRTCLGEWRASSVNAEAFSKCTQCLFKYIYVPYEDSRESELNRIRKYRFTMSGYLLAYLLINELIALGITGFLYWADAEKTFVNAFPVSSQGEPFLIYHLLGWVGYFALIGLIGLIYLISAYCAGNTPVFCYCSDCNCGSSDEGNSILFVLIIIMFIILVLTGIFIGLYVSVRLFMEKGQEVSDQVWKFQETKKFIVKDFQGHENELYV